MTTETTQAQTMAEQIAGQLDHDGQRWTAMDGRSFADLMAGASRSYEKRGVVGASVRYDFADGSAIIDCGGMCWDLAAPGASERDCFCCAGAEHGRHYCEADWS